MSIGNLVNALETTLSTLNMEMYNIADWQAGVSRLVGWGDGYGSLLDPMLSSTTTPALPEHPEPHKMLPCPPNESTLGH